MNPLRTRSRATSFPQLRLTVWSRELRCARFKRCVRMLHAPSAECPMQAGEPLEDGARAADGGRTGSVEPPVARAVDASTCVIFGLVPGIAVRKRFRRTQYRRLDSRAWSGARNRRTGCTELTA